MSQLAWITGSTAGIGKATAYLLAKQGYNLVLTGRRQERLLEIQKDLQMKYPHLQIHTLCFDVQDRQQTQQVISAHPDLVSAATVLINNAGLAKGLDPIPEGSFDDWEQMIDTNIKGLLLMTRCLVPGMKARGNGHIVNIGSIAGRWTYPGGGVYCATKFAVRALTEGLRFDLMGSNVRVTNVAPGMVETEFSVVRFGNQQAADKVYAGMTPLKAEDIAETILWCLQRPAHVNVQELVIYPTDQVGIQHVARRS
jgi:NADP-dependent 3-hydroxy acid dehydrogenase YdfG